MVGFRIFVLDTNAVIDLKKKVSLEDQWEFFLLACDRVQAGHIAFPRQVVREISYVKFPDAPGAWLVGVASHMNHAQPSDDTLASVLAVAPHMVDPDADRDPADPYVVAMAQELDARDEFEVSVVSSDKTDRPGNTSVVTACGHLGLPMTPVDEFIEWVKDTGSPEQLTLE